MKKVTVIHFVTCCYNCPYFKNHPCSVWARENNKNWIWLYRHTQQLFDEFCKIRYRNKDHGCYAIWYQLLDYYNCLPKANFMTPMVMYTIITSTIWCTSGIMTSVSPSGPTESSV